MPRVTEFSRFNIMGVALSTRTTKIEPILAWESKLRLGEFNPEIGALWFRRRDWVGCTTATVEPPDITNYNYKDHRTKRGQRCAFLEGGDFCRHCSHHTF